MAVAGVEESLEAMSMSAVRIKICGITRVEDGLAAAEAGADAVGFMFYAGSPRCLTPSAAASISHALPPFVTRVGVFVNASPAEVTATLAACPLDALQFHGEEPPDFCQRFGRRVIRAFRIRDPQSLEQLPSYQVDAWLLDAFVEGQRGGTGQVFNWNLAVQAKALGRPIILAGGLNPQNVGEAVRAVRPYGVDVSSGVESSPGRKDSALIRALVRAVRGLETSCP